MCVNCVTSLDAAVAAAGGAVGVRVLLRDLIARLETLRRGGALLATLALVGAVGFAGLGVAVLG